MTPHRLTWIEKEGHYWQGLVGDTVWCTITTWKSGWPWSRKRETYYRLLTQVVRASSWEHLGDYHTELDAAKEQAEQLLDDFINVAGKPKCGPCKFRRHWLKQQRSHNKENNNE
jgi:hypothetical protein